MNGVVTPRYRGRVPNAPKTPSRPVRLDEEDWEALGEAALAQGANRSAVIREFVRWYLGRPGAELPERPAASARERGRSVKVDAEVWNELPTDPADPYASRANLINRVLAWYLRHPGIALPEHPPVTDEDV